MKSPQWFTSLDKRAAFWITLGTVLENERSLGLDEFVHLLFPGLIKKQAPPIFPAKHSSFPRPFQLPMELRPRLRSLPGH
jgi:hypothetical protein